MLKTIPLVNFTLFHRWRTRVACASTTFLSVRLGYKYLPDNLTSDYMPTKIYTLIINTLQFTIKDNSLMVNNILYICNKHNPQTIQLLS